MTTRTILAAMTVLGLAMPAAAESVGFVAAVRGKAELRGSGSSAFKAASIDQDISQGDTLRTGRNAWAKVVLDDQTSFAVDEETELVFDRIALGKADSSRFEMLSGHVRTKIGETFGAPTRMKLFTPTAVMGAKGTEWLTWVRAENTWVCVIEGIVGASNRDPSVIGELDLGPGSCARIGQDQAPERVAHPGDLEPTAMRQGPTPGMEAFPASLEPVDRTIIETNDTRPEIDLPEPTPPTVVFEVETRPRGNNNNPGPPLTNIP
jgi:hypothetical protein